MSNDLSDRLQKILLDYRKNKSQKTNKPKTSFRSKMEVFEWLFKSLEDKNGFVNSELMIEKMQKTGLFTELQARSYFTRMHRKCCVYESKPGFFKWA